MQLITLVATREEGKEKAENRLRNILSGMQPDKYTAVYHIDTKEVIHFHVFTNERFDVSLWAGEKLICKDIDEAKIQNFIQKHQRWDYAKEYHR